MTLIHYTTVGDFQLKNTNSKKMYSKITHENKVILMRGNECKNDDMTGNFQDEMIVCLLMNALMWYSFIISLLCLCADQAFYSYHKYKSQW